MFAHAVDSMAFVDSTLTTSSRHVPLCVDGRRCCRQERKSLYAWGPWGTHRLKLCGGQYTQGNDCSVHLNQKEYSDSVKFAPARRLTKRAQKNSTLPMCEF